MSQAQYNTPKKGAGYHDSPEEQKTVKNESLKSNSNDENKSETTEIPNGKKKVKSKSKKTLSLNSKNLELEKETQNIKKSLDTLTKPERLEALSVSSESLVAQIQKDVDCVGCFNQLQSYIQENFSNLRKNGQGPFNLYTNTTLGLTVYSNNEDIAHLLAELKVNSDVLQEFNKDLSIKKKDTGVFKKSKIHRCLLHSKKPISNKNLYSIIESNINDFQEYIQIDEGLFLKNLNTYFKKRRFCNTCQENILFAYERLKENAESPQNLSEDEELSSDQEILNIENNPDYLPGSTSLQGIGPRSENSEAMHYHCQCKCHIIENFSNCQCSCDEKLSKCSEMADDECENIDIISIIKFCNQNKQIVFPAQVEIMKEFLSRSETDFSIHSRHTLTKEAAQEELLICLGLTLKDKLQDHWKARKSEEIIRLMFYNIATHCIIENINSLYAKKMNLHNQKTALEEYLQQEELSKELRKEKLKKKRFRKREKKKCKKNGSNPKQTLTDIEEDTKPEELLNNPNSSDIRKHQNNFKVHHLSEDKPSKSRRVFEEIPEREREFLIRMGWQEDTEEYLEEWEHEINVIQLKRKEIEKERENFRRNLSERFMKLIQKS